MKKKIVILLISCSIACVLMACGKKTESNSDLSGVVNVKDNASGDTDTVTASGDAGWIDETYGAAQVPHGMGDTYLSAYPLFYTDDFGCTDYECIFADVLSMAKAKVITPSKMEKSLSKKEIASSDDMAKKVAAMGKLKLKTGEFSLQQMQQVISAGGSVVVHVQNKSPYGDHGAFFLIEEILNDGTFVGLTPSYTLEQQFFTNITNDHRTIYSTAPLIEACGSNSKVYYFTPED